MVVLSLSCNFDVVTGGGEHLPSPANSTGSSVTSNPSSRRLLVTGWEVKMSQFREEVSV